VLSLAEQLAALPVIDSLKHAATPAGLTKLPFVNADGTWTEATGWSPASFEAARSGGNHSGLYDNSGAKSGNYAVGIKKTSGSLANERQFELWLFMDGSAELTGYQFLVQSATGGTVQFILRRWSKGVEKVLFESAKGLSFKENDSIYLAMVKGIVSVHYREGEGTPKQLFEVADKTFIEGKNGFGGNGSNPKLINFSGGTIEVPVESRVTYGKSYPPDQMAIRVDTPNGTAARWAEDEPGAENVLSDIEISDEMPGGWKSLAGTLARDPMRDWRDIEPYAEVVAYQPGISEVFRGFLDKAQDTSGEQTAMAPAALGWQAVLEDNQACQVGFIDCDLSKWGDPSTQRRSDLAKAGIYLQPNVVNGFQSTAQEGPGVVIDFSDINNSSAKTVRGEPIYYGGGVQIDYLLYWFKVMAGPEGNAAWLDQIQFGNNAEMEEWNPGNDHDAKTNTNKPEKATSTIKNSKYVAMASQWPNGTGSMTDIHAWLWPKVIGKHGLTVQGTWPNVGFTAKQMIEYLIKNFAQPLTVDPEFIDDEPLVITQAWYGDPTSTADIAKDILKYGLLDWFIYNKKRFELRKPGTYGKYWKAYVGPSNLNQLGIDSQRLWRDIVVSYTDPNGNTRTAGPIGSGCDTESEYLEITDTNHPAVQADRTRNDIIDLQGIATPATAIEVGKRFLEEANLLNRSGSATLTGYVMDQYGVFWPAACVRSGDWISFVDASDPGYRKIVNKTYRHSERSSEIDLDAPASGLEALLERLQSGLLSLGVS
jgi:hypothetical protein